MIATPEARSVCLFFDVDGTLLEIAPRPEDVTVPLSLIGDLARASELLEGAVAFVSGRTILELDRLFAPLRFAAAGVHGAELRMRPTEPVVGAWNERLPDQLWPAVTALLSRFPGTFAENKDFAIAVHHREIRRSVACMAVAMDSLVAASGDPSLTILRGRNVLEIKRRNLEKGGAIEALMTQPEFAGRRPIFIGDDTTDLPGFATVLRAGGLAYSVGHSIPGLTGAFESPREVREWLGDIVHRRERAA